jgi:hypothetical protein
MTEFKIGDKVLVKPGEVSLTGWTPEDYTTPLPVTHVDDYGRVVSLAGVLEYSFRPEQLTPAPLDPSKVKPGDTVTLESVLEAPFKVTGVVEKIDITLFDADGLAVAFNVMIWSRWFTVGINLRLTDHQPAPEPEPEPEYTVGHVYEAKVANVGRVQVVRVAPDMGELYPFPWFVPSENDHYAERVVTDVRPLVVIDPDDADGVRAAAIATGVSTPKVRAVLEHLGLNR